MLEVFHNFMVFVGFAAIGIGVARFLLRKPHKDLEAAQKARNEAAENLAYTRGELDGRRKMLLEMKGADNK